MSDRYEKVFDHQKRRVRGLWVRNGIFYAQICKPGTTLTTKVRLKADTRAAATDEMRGLRDDRANGTLALEPKRGVPHFTEVAELYRNQLTATANSNNHKRIKSSIDALNQYFAFVGDKMVNQIIMGDALNYALWRKEHPMRQGWDKVSGRAIDLDIIAFRHVMDYAKDHGHIKVNPIGKWKALAEKPKEVRLVPTEEVETLIKTAATAISTHFKGGGQQFADYLTVLANSGGREQETLRLRWSVNVDWNNRRLGFGQDGLSKYAKSRWVTMNGPLEIKLKEMYARRNPNCDCLFPTPRPGAGKVEAPVADRPVKTYRNALATLKKKCNTTGGLGFHHFRHYFISVCCMSNIDMKTCQEWVGHEDLDLIAKIYAHLTDQHKTAQAAKFNPAAARTSP